MSDHPAFTDTERTRTSLSASAALQWPFANPILLVDPDVELRTSSVRCNGLRSLSEATHVDPRDNPHFIQKARSAESSWRAVTLAWSRPRSNRPT